MLLLARHVPRPAPNLPAPDRNQQDEQRARGHRRYSLTLRYLGRPTVRPGAHNKRQKAPHSVGTWCLYADGVPPSGAVICQVPILGDTFVVRDQGGPNGSSLCQALIVANGAAASP